MGMSPKARHKARMFAMQAIYQWQIADGEPGAIQAQYMKDNAHHKVDWDFFKSITDEVFANKDEFNELLDSAKKNEKTEILPIERGLIWLGLAELKFHIDVPYKVSIKEYVSLAEEFAAADGFGFVNGVLDTLAPKIRNPLL